MPFLDGYEADAATVRGIVRSTVRDHLRRAGFFNSLGEKTENFYRTLKVGSTVHYHNAFGAYVRCVVVENSEPGQNKSGRALKPLALVVDDSDLTRKMLCRIMRSEGYDVEEAVDGLGAVEKVRKSIAFRPRATISALASRARRSL